MVAANTELTHQRLRTPANRTSMMAKAIMPVLDVLKGRIADTNQRLTSQYRMMQMAHHRYDLLFRCTHVYGVLLLTSLGWIEQKILLLEQVDYFAISSLNSKK